MANILNNFGLTEKTLTTEGKWCTADIEVKIDSAELENINSEYLRSGVEVFGIHGNYGNEASTVVIPAGIYEIIPDFSNTYLNAQITFYQSGAFYKGIGWIDDIDDGYTLCFYDEANNKVPFCKISDYQPENTSENTWFDHLVFVPYDQELDFYAARNWYLQMHPYVSSAAHNTCTFELPRELPGGEVQGAYIRKVFEYLGHLDSDTGYYHINGNIPKSMVPFSTSSGIQRLELWDNESEELMELKIAPAGDAGDTLFSDTSVTLYSGGVGGSPYGEGNFEMYFIATEERQYWAMKNSYSETSAEILAFLIAIGAEPDPTHDCDICGETFYVSDFEVLWECSDHQVN